MSQRRKAKRFLSGKAWVAHRMEMITSPAWRVLSINGRRVIDRLEIEHMQHGGAENGSLKCTRDDFAAYGIRRQSISEALVEVEALGFVEITRRGYIGARYVQDRLPSLYRLTFVVENRDFADPPSDEWRRLESVDAAEEAKATALVELERERRAEAVARAKRVPAVGATRAAA